MLPFAYERIDSPRAAVAAFTASPEATHYLAGGTTLIDLMKLNVMRPAHVVDINALQRTQLGQITADGSGLRLGALARMAEAAEHPEVKSGYPVIAQALQLAASQQIRNMATLGGNVLQRTRCPYFRDTSYANCNKRNPGSGCAALGGFNRSHAVLGTSEQCIASYPGDFAQALLALDAQVEIDGSGGARRMPFADLHKPPGETPHIETTLLPGDLITGFNIPAAPWAKRSLYLKIRDRQSYEFALASAAVALDLDNGKIRQVHIALGGVATRPWRATEAEAALVGNAIDDSTLEAAAEAAFEQALPREHNKFKIELGRRTLVRALHQAAAMEVPT
jgi:xanthine dehydrogenase YagS FAD-binding subunit